MGVEALAQGVEEQGHRQQADEGLDRGIGADSKSRLAGLGPSRAAIASMVVVMLVAASCAGDDAGPAGSREDPAPPTPSAAPEPETPEAAPEQPETPEEEPEAAPEQPETPEEQPEAPTQQPPPETATYKAVTTGSGHSCAIATDDTITCWGDADYGRTNAPAGTYKTITAGTFHNCAMATDDTITCWGISRFWKADAPAGAYRTVNVGGDHSCALATDNTITCWGPSPPTEGIHSPGIRWLAETPAEDPEQAPPESASSSVDRNPEPAYKTVTAGEEHSCAIATDDTITCWNLSDAGPTDAPAGTYKAVSSSSGGATCAIATDDTITCWGNNYYGQADAPAGTYKAITTAPNFSCAIATDDTITCWGLNDSRHTNTPAGTYKAITVGTEHGCAIATDDTITCWGPVPPPEGIRWLGTRWLGFRQLKIFD